MPTAPGSLGDQRIRAGFLSPCRGFRASFALLFCKNGSQGEPEPLLASQDACEPCRYGGVKGNRIKARNRPKSNGTARSAVLAGRACSIPSEQNSGESHQNGGNHGRIGPGSEEHQFLLMVAAWSTANPQPSAPTTTPPRLLGPPGQRDHRNRPRRLTASHPGGKETPENLQCRNGNRGRRDQFRPAIGVRRRHPLRDLGPGPVGKDDDGARLPASNVATAYFQLMTAQWMPRIADHNTGFVSTTSPVRPASARPTWPSALAIAGGRAQNPPGGSPDRRLIKPLCQSVKLSGSFLIQSINE